MSLKSVGMKISLSIIASSLFFVIFMGVASYQISKNVMQTKVTDASLQTIVQAGQKLDFVYQLYQKLSLQLVMDAPLQQQVGKASNLKKDSREYNDNMSILEATLSAYLYSNEGIQSMELFTSNGDIIQTKSSLMSEKNYGDQDWFKAIVAKDGEPLWLSTKPKDNRTTSPVISVGSLIHQANSNEYYIALFDISLDIVKNQLASIQMGDSGAIQVVDGAGLVVYSQDSAQMGATSGYPIREESQGKKSDSFVSTDGTKQIVLSKSEATGWFNVGIIPIHDLTKDMEIIYNLTLIVSPVLV